MRRIYHTIWVTICVIGLFYTFAKDLSYWWIASAIPVVIILIVIPTSQAMVYRYRNSVFATRAIGKRYRSGNPKQQLKCIRLIQKSPNTKHHNLLLKMAALTDSAVGTSATKALTTIEPPPDPQALVRVLDKLLKTSTYDPKRLELLANFLDRLRFSAKTNQEIVLYSIAKGNLEIANEHPKVAYPYCKTILRHAHSCDLLKAVQDLANFRFDSKMSKALAGSMPPFESDLWRIILCEVAKHHVESAIVIAKPHLDKDPKDTSLALRIENIFREALKDRKTKYSRNDILNLQMAFSKKTIQVREASWIHHLERGPDLCSAAAYGVDMDESEIKPTPASKHWDPGTETIFGRLHDELANYFKVSHSSPK